MVIFLHGLKGSGKDTTAKILIDKFNFKKVAFADPIKIVLMKTFNLKTEEEYDFFKRNDLFNGFRIVNGRDVLRNIGMLMRSYDDKQFINYVNKFINENKNAVVTDLRFDNELEYANSLDVKNDKKLLIKVKRDSIEQDNHISEKGFPDEVFEYVIENNGTLEELEEKVNKIINSLDNWLKLCYNYIYKIKELKWKAMKLEKS